MATHIERVVACVAPRQKGLITRAQLLDHVVPERTIDNYLAADRLERVHASVYGVPGAPDSWSRRALAATLASGGAAAVRSAAAIWDLQPVPESPIEVLVPFTTNPLADGFVVHRTRRPFAICVVDDIPATCVKRTLEDLARIVPARVLEELVDKALYRRLIGLDELRLARGLVGKLAADRIGSSPESVLETRFLRILRESGLPLPVAQYEVRRGGVLIARADFVYPAERIVIELEGYQYHSSRRAFDRGHDRFKQLQAAGYLVLPFTSTELRSPRALVAAVRRSLWERGHPDVVQI